MAVDSIDNIPSVTLDSSSEDVVNISLDCLKPFANHPFKPYEGRQLEDLIHSIQILGIQQPILVRRSGDENYEILSGHNRVNAAKKLD